MNDQIARLKQDVQTIQTALGLEVWTRRDVRRGFLGALGGGVASLFLALWMFYRGAPDLGIVLYLTMLEAIVILKAVGYRKSPTPSPGTQREVTFYNRYYFIGSALLGCFYFWGLRQGMDMQVLLASVVVIAGMWYAFYAISARSRSLSLAGAVPLIIGGFVLPEAKGIPQALCWLGLASCLGCWFEAALLLAALRHPGNAANPPGPASAPIPAPVPDLPEGALSAHAAH